MERLPCNKGESFYDIFEDWGLIESSFYKQYGIRLRSADDLSWSEFCNLLSGLMHDTPLGSVVSIRAETDNEIISRFTPEQKRIKGDWDVRRMEELKKDEDAYQAHVEKMWGWVRYLKK